MATEVVTFGEAMVRLTPPGHQRLEQARTVDVYVGGAELNVAVGATRLGLASRWVSRLTENALGRMIAGRAREQGVDVSVEWTPADRAGVYFVELGSSPRAATVLYDRAGSAMSKVAPGAIDWTGPRAFEGARWFHTSGVTPALSDSAAATVADALAAAKKAGLTVSYDLNYRAKLWSVEKARAVQEPLMRYVDVLIASEETASAVFGVGEPEQLQERLGVRTIALTHREESRAREWSQDYEALVRADGAVHRGPTFHLDIVDPIGAGDAFVAGLIFGKLRCNDWSKAVQYGTALAALKHTVPGDFSQATLEEVEALLRSGDDILRVKR